MNAPLATARCKSVATRFDDSSVLALTVDWAVEHGIETATFHVLTPYPGTVLYSGLQRKVGLRTPTVSPCDRRHAVSGRE